MQQYNGQQGNSSPSIPSFNNPAEKHKENGYKTQAENNRPDFGAANLEGELRNVLSPGHLRMLLEESGISAEAVEARGYRTVETKAELERLGFAGSQRNTPGLLIPIHTHQAVRSSTIRSGPTSRASRTVGPSSTRPLGVLAWFSTFIP